MNGPNRRSWNLGLYSWQNSSNPDELDWTHSQNKRREISEKLRQRNKEVAENEENHS